MSAPLRILSLRSRVSLDTQLADAITAYGAAKKRHDTRGQSAASQRLWVLRIKVLRRDRRRSALIGAAIVAAELACIAAFIAGVVCVGLVLTGDVL